MAMWQHYPASSLWDGWETVLLAGDLWEREVGETASLSILLTTPFCIDGPREVVLSSKTVLIRFVDKSFLEQKKEKEEKRRKETKIGII